MFEAAGLTQLKGLAQPQAIHRLLGLRSDRAAEPAMVGRQGELNQLMADEDDLLVIPLCEQCEGKVPDHSTGDQSVWADKPATFQIV